MNTTLKVHLGNTRVSFDENSVTVKQEDHYYPFGMRLGGGPWVQAGTGNKFLYNGKELEDDLGLNWYHYGARFYDAQLGRWHTIDPADEFQSPYVYTGNNPIIFVDPDGRDVKVTDVLSSNEYEYEFWLKYAQTEAGIAQIARYANEGDVIAGVKYEKTGEFAKDLLLFDMDLKDRDPKTQAGYFDNDIWNNHILNPEKSQQVLRVSATKITEGLDPQHTMMSYVIDNFFHEVNHAILFSESEFVGRYDPGQFALQQHRRFLQPEIWNTFGSFIKQYAIRYLPGPYDIGKRIETTRKFIRIQAKYQ